MGWTRFEQEGEHVGHASYTIYKAEQNCIIVLKGGSGVVEEIEHGKIDQWLDDCVEMVYCVLGEKISETAHAR